MNTDIRFDDPLFLLAQDARLRALARRLVQDAALADDVVQDSWIHALRGSARVESRVGGWLSGIVRHVAFGARRERSTRESHERGATPPSAGPSTEDLVAREAARRAVVGAVMQLAEPARTAIVLRFFDDLPSRAIAAQLGIPVETVRTRIKRALEQLRRELDRAHGGDGRAWVAALSPIVAAQKAAVGTLALVGIAAALLMLGTLGVLTFIGSRAPSRDVKPVAVVLAPSATDAPTASVVHSEPERASLATDSEIVGRVVDEQGHSIADARVILTQQYFEDHGSRNDKEGTTNTSADGRFAFEGVPLRGAASGAQRSDTLFADHPDFIGRTIVLERRVDVTIALRRRVRLEGTIRDAVTHEPLASVPLALQRIFIFGSRETLAKASSGPDGRYSFAVAPESDAIVCAQPTGAVPTIVPASIGTEAVTMLDIDVPPTRSVVVEVRALTSRKPLAGLPITVGEQGLVMGERLAAGTTDAGGRCEIRNVPVCGCVGAIRDEASAMDIGFMIPPVDVDTTAGPIVIAVPEPWTVRGRLFDPDGSPIAGASVSVAVGPRTIGAVDRATLLRRYGPAVELVQYVGKIGNRRATSAADGSFELVHPVFPGEVVTLTAQRAKAEVSHVVATIDDPRPASTHDIGAVVVANSGSLFIQVLYGPTNIPCPTVVAVHASRRATWTSDRGAAFFQHDLEPGTWTLTATSPGLGASEPTTVEIVAETRSRVNLNLATHPEDDPVTSGIALDAEGRPLPRARLTASQSVGPVQDVTTDDPIMRARRQRPLEHFFETDDAGHFEFRTPRALGENLTLAFEDEAKTQLATVRPGSTNVVIRKPPAARFRLRLVDGSGVCIATPIALEWRVRDVFETISGIAGFSPSAAGMLSFSWWPHGPLTLRIRRAYQTVDQAVIAEVNVCTNDDASAPTIVLP